MNNVLYCAIVLDEKSHKRLVNSAEFAATEMWKNDDYKILSHHSTLVFKPSDNDEVLQWCKEHEGETYAMYQTAIGFSDQAIAIKIKCSAPCANKIMHITLAVNESNGGKPVDSNNIKSWLSIEKHVPYTGQVKIFYKN